MPDEPTQTQEERSLLEQLVERRGTLLNEIEPMIGANEERIQAFESRTAGDEAERPSDEDRDAHNAEMRRFNEEIADRSRELSSLNLRIERQELIESSRDRAADASRGEMRITNEPLTYRRDNQRARSYFLDLAMAQSPQFRSQAPSPRTEGWQERLDAHSSEMRTVMPKRWQERERRAQEQVEGAEREIRSSIRGMEVRGLEQSPFERGGRALGSSAASMMEERAPSRIVGQGGYAIPPLWLIDEYIPALRPGRVAAGLARQMTLPEGTDSINIPRLQTPTLTAVQTADAAPVASRDITDTFQQANVKTIAGQEDVPIQLIEQSPGQILDQVLMTDLTADYNQKVDLQVIQGNGVGAPLSGGQVVGIYPAANWGANSITWTNASPTAQIFFQVLGANASKVAQTRFNLQDFTFLVHPRRWFWAATGLDSTGRFLVESQDFNPFNATALEADPTPAEGYVGRVPFGPKVYIDPNVPANDTGAGAAGGTNDIAIGALWNDLWLFEGDLRTRVLTEVLSGTLELRFQIYGYLAFLQRYGVSVSITVGSGLAAPVLADGTAF